MLVLTRKYQEKIKIGDNITITILRMKGKAVRLGIEAPTDVPVIRGELSFEGYEASESAEVEEAEVPAQEFAAASAPSRSGRTFGRASGMHAKWETNSQSESESHREPAATVAFGRVSRDSVSKVLPKLISGKAPLRSAMEQSRG